MTRRQADLALLTATFLWGTSFVAVKSALADATPFAFIAVRFGIAALALAPGTHFRPGPGRGELVGGLLLGTLVAVGFISQTAGLVITTPSRSAFIVAVSSILAPVIALALLGQRPSWLAAAALALAMFGIYLLTAPDAGGLNRGDLLTLICAGCFGGQIVAVTVLSPRYDARRLVFWQIAVTAVLGALAAGLLPRRTRVHGTVREHDLLPAANVRTATHVVGAGGIDLLLRAAVRRAHLLAGARGAALTGAVGRRCADPARHAGGGATLATGAGAKRGDTGRLRSRPA